MASTEDPVESIIGHNLSIISTGWKHNRDKTGELGNSITGQKKEHNWARPTRKTTNRYADPSNLKPWRVWEPNWLWLCITAQLPARA